VDKPQKIMTTSSESWRLYFRLLRYAKPYWRIFAVAVICMVFTAATEPVFPAIMKYLLDSGFKTAEPYMIWAIPGGVVLLFTVRGFLSFCTNYLMARISMQLGNDLQRELFAKLLTLPTSIFQDQPASKIISRIVVDVGNANQAATNVLIILVRESLTALALFVYLIYLDWALTLMTLVIAPLLALVIKVFSYRMRQSSRMTLKGIQNLAHTVEEAVNAHKVVKIFNAQNQLKIRFHSDLHQLRMAATREAVPSSAITPITHLVASAAVAGIIFLALSQVTGQAGASAGGFVSFITAMLMMIGPIKQLTTVNMVMQRSLSACESFFELIDCKGESDLGMVELSNVSGDIRFEDVSFTYPHASRQALSKVSFSVKAGSTVALVGASGGGKSTISSLLPRFYNPAFGQILIDGVDISNVKLFSLRQNISLVTQDIVLFNDSVYANIAFGSSLHSSKEQVILAAKAAYAWDFICQLPNGLDTLIGEDGAKLSGGQRQRIAIARAVLKNSPILILDEATSALDTESERHVQMALASLMKDRTTLVIAHRLSTIEHADQILVLDQGRIVERGTHNELLTKGSYYTNLIKMQTGGLG